MLAFNPAERCTVQQVRCSAAQLLREVRLPSYIHRVKLNQHTPLLLLLDAAPCALFRLPLRPPLRPPLRTPLHPRGASARGTSKTSDNS
jgi:hypothetical protein